MPLYRLQPVTTEPTATLRSWSVFEIAPGERHLCGYSSRDAEGRVTSVLTAFDPAEAAFTTSSGRVYRLEGAPGHDPDAEYVRRRWLAAYGCPSTTDVTGEVWKAIEQARASETTGDSASPDSTVNPA
jgi:hypothetical protein